MLHFLSTITRDKGYKKIISERILCIHLTASYMLQNHNCQLYVLFLFVCVLFHFKGLHHKVKKQRSSVSIAIFENFDHERFPAVASQ